jgi:hypothetical protein
MVESISSRLNLQSRSFYIKALKQHRRAVALIITTILTVPLFLFTSLPPIEVLEEIQQEVEESIEVPISVNRTIEVEVNRTIEVEVNITEEVVLNRTIGVNITEGGSIFLEPQPAPALIGSDIILCIDTSGSMEPENMPVAKAAIINFLDLLNKSNTKGITNDRVALVSFHGGVVDWTTHATVHTDLDYISNQTHLNNVLTQVNGLSGSGGTDIWAGLNASLDILFNQTRDEIALKSVFLLTDGLHQSGPWDQRVELGFYNEFMTSPSDDLPLSQSPVVVARENDVRIYSIGLFEGSTFGFDSNFLMNISLNVTHGTFGDFFVGNDTLSVTEGFMNARDSASGWSLVQSIERNIFDNNSNNLFSLNVTNEIRRLKWDLNWNNSLINFNLSIVDPNGTVRYVDNGSYDDIVVITLDRPKSVIIDFPVSGNWTFNITCTTNNASELIKSRLSSYEPPIFIESISQFNSSEFNISEILNNTLNEESIVIDPNNTPDINIPSFKILNTMSIDSLDSQSVIFLVNVTNKNPAFTYHNITPFLLGNFSAYNISAEWTPSSFSDLSTGNTSVFMFNLIFNEPVFLQGTIYFKVNCTEGYYDAVAQDVQLDYRVTTENITIETYTENQTITVIENQTTVVIENQTILTVITTQQLTMITKYTYDRQVFDTLKWGGFFASLGILLSFLAVYVTAQAYHLRGLAKKFRTRLFPDYSFLEAALQEKGISVAPDTLSAVIDNTTNLDQFGENIFSLTGKKLTPEDLILLTSGVSTDQIINRLSFVTRLSPGEIGAMLNEAKSVESLIESLNLDVERFLDIITNDEQVISFQSKVASMIKPKYKIDSSIILYDDLDMNKFRSQLRNKLK